MTYAIGQVHWEAQEVHTLSRNFVNFGPQTASAGPVLFRPQSIAHAVSGINVVFHTNINKTETVLNLSAAQIRSPKNFTLKWHHVGRPRVAMRC